VEREGAGDLRGDEMSAPQIHESKQARETHWNEERKRQTRAIDGGERRFREEMEKTVITYDLNSPEGKAVAAQCTPVLDIKECTFRRPKGKW